MEPNDLRNSIGMNYRYRSFLHNATRLTTTNTGEKHATGNTVLSETKEQQEVFKSYDLWATIFISSKWQLMGSVSFVDNSYFENDSSLYNISGPGDLSITGRYLLFNSKVNDSSKMALRWSLGGGIKAPVGNYTKTYTVTPSLSNKGNTVYGTPYEEVDPHMQGGTGSWDFVLLSEFLIRRKNLGLSTDISYRFNTENPKQFRFANRLNSSIAGFYLWKLKALTLAPSTGLSYESSKRDQLAGKDYANSGGYALFSTFGVKLYVKSISIGFSYQNPIEENLNDNQLPNQKRLIGNLTYYL
jgi:hypothetical protein